MAQSYSDGCYLSKKFICHSKTCRHLLKSDLETRKSRWSFWSSQDLSTFGQSVKRRFSYVGLDWIKRSEAGYWWIECFCCLMKVAAHDSGLLCFWSKKSVIKACCFISQLLLQLSLFWNVVSWFDCELYRQNCLLYHCDWIDHHRRSLRNQSPTIGLSLHSSKDSGRSEYYISLCFSDELLMTHLTFYSFFREKWYWSHRW